MTEAELQRRKDARSVRVRARLAEIQRLQGHPQQQHAMHLLLARGHRLASQRDPNNRAWWIRGARSWLERAREYR